MKIRLILGIGLLVCLFAGCQIADNSTEEEVSIPPPVAQEEPVFEEAPEAEVLEDESEAEKLSEGEIEDLMRFYESKLALFGSNNADCSGDLFDLFSQVARESENAFLDQFPVSLTDEMELGAEIHDAMLKEFSLAAAGSESRKIEKILDRLTPHVQRSGMVYQIFLVEESSANAFSIPGGYIYVTTGLMDFVESTDELAFVIGHEVAHIDRKHCVRKYQKLALGKALLQDFGVMAANFQILLSTPFGQVDEYEADKYGAKFADKAGYDAHRGKDFFSKLKQDESYNLLEKLLRSHPFSSQREDCLDQYLNDLEG